jgi:hypothetical protein
VRRVNRRDARAWNSDSSASLRLLLGPLVGYFGHGYFSALGAMAAELFPAAVRSFAKTVTEPETNTDTSYKRKLSLPDSNRLHVPP